MASDIEVYGADWCGLTYRVREYLTNTRLGYEYHDVDQDPRAQQFVLDMNDGKRRLPMVVIQERILTNPTIAELQRVIDEHDISSVARATRRAIAVLAPAARARRR